MSYTKPSTEGASHDGDDTTKLFDWDEFLVDVPFDLLGDFYGDGVYDDHHLIKALKGTPDTLKAALEADPHFYCSPLRSEEEKMADLMFCATLFSKAAEEDDISKTVILFQGPHFKGILRSDYGHEWSKNNRRIWLAAFMAGAVDAPDTYTCPFKYFQGCGDLKEELSKHEAWRKFV